jgi:hypothetical protein
VLLRPRPAPYTAGVEAASSDEITRRLERDLPPGVPPVRFEDAAGAAGIDFRHFRATRSTQLPEDMGSGAAWGDYDGDGDPDLYLVNVEGPLPLPGAAPAASGARSALYRNDAGRFTDVTERAGVGAGGCGMGAAWGDYDGDGDLDLYVTRFGTNLLYRNGGDGTFAEVARVAGVAGPVGFWTGASWSDYDRDGDLDLYVAGYVRYRHDPELARRTSLQYRAVVPFTLNPSSFEPERNLLFRNDGGVFRETARDAGVDNPTGRSLAAAWGDFDADGWPDLYVANDVSDNAFFRNLGNGRFEDRSHAAWVADYRGAMGLAAGDWDLDLDLDLFVTHWIAQENALYSNLTAGEGSGGAGLRFLDVADQVGLGQIALDYVGWATEFFDYDNDGRPDLYAVDGSTFQREDDPSRLVPMRNLLFWNAGPRQGFHEVGQATAGAFATENVGRGGAAADYDGDGDLDLAIVVNGGPARLLRNDGGNASGWLRLVLRGPGRAASSARKGGRHTNSFAVGARVLLGAGGVTQLREVGAGASYLSQPPPGEVHFGLGGAPRIDRLEILWPDGTRQELPDLPARATVRVTQGNAPVIETAAAAGPAATPPAGPATAAPVAGAATDRDRVRRFWQHFNDATALRIRDDCAGAAGEYEGALRLDPRHEDSWYYLGQCRRLQGRTGEAAAAFGTLLEINPQSARGHLALGALLADPAAGAPDLEAAETHFRMAHDINAEETGPMLRLAEVLIVRGAAAEAGRWLEDALRTNARSVESACLLGYLAWERGDRAGGRAFYERAVGAGRVETPVQGVLGEGDRRAAPPLQSPMGRTLLAAPCGALRGAAPGPGPARGPGPDGLYRSIEERVAALRSGAGKRNDRTSTGSSASRPSTIR